MIIHGVEFNGIGREVSLVKFRKKTIDTNDELEKYFAKMKTMSNDELDEIYEAYKKKNVVNYERLRNNY